LDAFVARLTAGLTGGTVADMSVAFGALPGVLAPGVSYPGLGLSCTNAGPDPATSATCAVAVSAGTVSAVSCTPAVPVGSLAAGGTIACTFTFTTPGSQGGGNTPETGVTFTFTAGAANDANPANNTATSGPTPIPLVDALDDAATLPANAVGATFNVGANDQYGTGSLPSTATFSLLGGTTCVGATWSGFGVVSFNVPGSGSCLVNYQVCVGSACDTARLTVTAQQVDAIPTLDLWGLVLLLVLVAGAGVLLLRQVGA
jgi:hypothetical protein